MPPSASRHWPFVARDAELSAVVEALTSSYYDGVLAEAEAVIERDQDAVYIEHGVPFGLAGAVEGLRSVIAEAAPYRGMRP